jgi:phage tail-like protein
MKDNLNDGIGLALRFHVTLDGKDLGYWSKADGLDVKWDLCEFRAGDAGNHRWYYPGAATYKNVTLTRAVSVKGAAEVLSWLKTVSFDSVKSNGVIRLLDTANKHVAEWVLEEVLPVHWTGPQFDAKAGNVAYESLELAHLGWLPDSKPGS